MVNADEVSLAFGPEEWPASRINGGILSAKVVAGVDTSTQSVKVTLRNIESGALVAESRASHPDGTECDPREWQKAFEGAFQQALDTAINQAKLVTSTDNKISGISDIAAISIGGQQHGAVVLNSSGEPVRKALLWNDTRSAKQAEELNQEFGGAQATADAVGSLLVASFTATKLRWIADQEPSNADQIAAVCLPHDYLSWKLSGSNSLEDLFTDRSDASGTGYFDSRSNSYRKDLLSKALRGREVTVPKVLAPDQIGGEFKGIPIAPGAGDNAGAALGIGALPGDVVVSLGTSGTAFAVSDTSTHDASGAVAGFADATGRFLPLVCTLNAARILDAACKLLKVSHDELAKLALSAQPGANGLTLLPYFEGERTPNRPNARGTLHGLSLANSDPANIARAYIEGMLCGLADAVFALEKLGVSVNRILLVGGAAKNPAVAPIAASIFGRNVLLPPSGEYVALGAAKQATWVATGALPEWQIGEIVEYESAHTPEIFARYQELVMKTETFSETF